MNYFSIIPTNIITVLIPKLDPNSLANLINLYPHIETVPNYLYILNLKYKNKSILDNIYKEFKIINYTNYNIIIRTYDIRNKIDNIKHLSCASIYKMDTLYLYEYNFRKLEKELFYLINLKRLYIHSPKRILEYIPYEIEYLTNLEVLLLDFHIIKEWPQQLFNLPNLEYLDIKNVQEDLVPIKLNHDIKELYINDLKRDYILIN
jgi:hypothetical protein